MYSVYTSPYPSKNADNYISKVYKHDIPGVKSTDFDFGYFNISC